MSNDRWTQLAASGGIVFVLLLAAALIFGPSLNPPEFGEGAAAVDAYVLENNNELQAAGALAFGAGYAFLFFLGALVMRIRGAEGAPGRLAATAAAGGIVYVALAGMGVGAHSTAAFLQRAGDGTPETVTALWDAGNMAFVFMGFGLAALLVAAGGAALRFGAVPDWLGWVSIAIGIFVFVVSLFGTFSEDNVFSPRDGLLGQIALFATLGWVGLASLVMLGSKGKVSRRR